MTARRRAVRKDIGGAAREVYTRALPHLQCRHESGAVMDRKILAVLGGTGQQGGALAMRWGRVGHEVVIGSRDPARAEAKARDIVARVPEARISGRDMAGAASAAAIVVLSVPYAVH